MHRVVALAVPAVVAFDLAIPAQVFGDVSERERYAFSVCTERPGLVPSTTGLDVHARLGLRALTRADTIVVPGYAARTDPSPAVLQSLRRAAARGARILSVCTGAFALGAAGLLDGHRATTHWQDAADLAARYPKATIDPDVLYVDDGQILTSAGVAAGIDLCLHVVRLDHGVDVATATARRMVVAPHRDGGQAQFISRAIPASGPGLAPTCQWMIEHLAEPLTVAAIARQAGWSERTLARKFLDETGTTPLRWLMAQRTLEAKRLLETTDLAVEQVAQRSGLGTAANLRLHLARDAGSTPLSYRRSFQGARRTGSTPLA